MIDWVLRFVKGMFIGSGFILPGVSGGALAAVFGVYERIISFLAHITRDFKRDVLYLLPIGLGGIAGVFLLSFAVSYFLGAYETQILWVFVGCVLGTIPTLWKQAGKQGRGGRSIAILIVVFIASLAFMLYGERLFGGGVPQNFGTWILAGALIGLGVAIPGFSPSNFLVYMGMYKDMTDAIKGLNFMVVIPIGIGGLLSVLLLSRLMDYAFRRAYSGLFHAILGTVFASTIMIIPRSASYSGFDVPICALLCAAGAALGYFMCALERKYKPD